MEMKYYMVIYVARHAETDTNRTSIICGNDDSFSINANGLKQSYQLAETMLGKGVDLIVCSPMKRALETAACLAERLDIEIIIDKRLRERNHGSFEGKSQDDPEFLIVKNQFAMRMNGGESIFDVAHRIYSSIDAIRKNYADKTVLIISHGGTIGRAIESYFNDLSNNEFVATFITNCELRKYEIGSGY